MKLGNTRQQWGLVSIFIHWLTALAVPGLFALGVWMVELDYYSTWYHRAPDIHRSIGMLLLILTLFRLLWTWFNQKPLKLETHTRLEQKLAAMAHVGLYVLLLFVMFSGYMISTAEGEGVTVFNWFTVPASVHGMENQADIAGAIHKYLAYGLIALVVLHAAAAIKHHLIDRDQTLTRMSGINRS